MKLRDLWNKYQKSGIMGGPVITDKELNELLEKLKEHEEFLIDSNPAILGIRMNQQSIESMIWNREHK